MGLAESDAIVIENAPLGIRAANNAHIKCIVTLNNTPLQHSDFEGLVEHELMFADTRSVISFLKEYCEQSG
jgi:beta-phosphoglucomutase-like phosphatase (HAD superfamily)